MMCANAQTTAATTDVPSGSTSTAYVPFADLPDVLTTEQAAAALQVDCKTVRSMVRRGELRGVRCGRLIRIPKAALVAFCEVG